jgi:hypothetical protein
LQDLVEIEDWNEYGELKLHVDIVHDGPAPAAPTPSGPPSKAPMSQENKKPEPTPSSSSKSAELSSPPAGAQPTSFTLAMRQAGQEAAQKAKDSMKKATVTLSGIGSAEPTKEKPGAKEIVPSISIPGPGSNSLQIETCTLLQSPTSTTWRRDPEALSLTTQIPSQAASLQSPNSTSWKPAAHIPVPERQGTTEVPAPPGETKGPGKDTAISAEDEEDDEEEEEEGM